MQVENLDSLQTNSQIETDLVIIGGGPAGLTIAREFFSTSTRVLILESGELREEACFSALNTVESTGEPRQPAQVRKRIELVGSLCPSWSNEVQRFGIRCRVFGGSSHAWLGKSTVFDEIDFAERPWVPYSGWPFRRESLVPYFDRAAQVLNLGPNCYDEAVWDLIGRRPLTELDGRILKSWFWQFARSRVNHRDIMRFGPDFLRLDAPNVRVLLNATVTRINTDETGAVFREVQVSSIRGNRVKILARAAVLAASAIENPRLLLLSASGVHPNGLGNQNDLVGRFLMDHPSGTIGRFKAEDAAAIVDRFGFYGVRHQGHGHIYTHGLVPSTELQERKRILHCAVFMAEEYAPEDPWGALKRLLHATSSRPISDLGAVVSGSRLLAKGIGIRLFESNAVPQQIKDRVVDAMIKWNTNFVVREFHGGGMPHKLKGVIINGITEQAPDPQSRITLSPSNTDFLGLPIPQIAWRIDHGAYRSIIQLGHLLATELPRAGLPAPILEDWIVQDWPQGGDLTDTGDTSGTTRMSDDPKRGVVDSRSQVHGVAGLYIAGASVFPTSGHANPTLMIVSLAIRLADQIKDDLAR
ncbi:MAG: GMC family oxidoreductase [Deltaproteobacteria bacterium]|nr:GMC family oxidoreductase [Deltaproteobacteria bacterium]